MIPNQNSMQQASAASVLCSNRVNNRVSIFTDYLVNTACLITHQPLHSVLIHA
jgi:hypothetical protein